MRRMKLKQVLISPVNIDVQFDVTEQGESVSHEVEDKAEAAARLDGMKEAKRLLDAAIAKAEVEVTGPVQEPDGTIISVLRDGRWVEKCRLKQPTPGFFSRLGKTR